MIKEKSIIFSTEIWKPVLGYEGYYEVSKNKKRGYGWDTNPFVYVIEFERRK